MGVNNPVFPWVALGFANNLGRHSYTKVLEEQIPCMTDGILFPTKAAAPHSQQEIGFIYKNHNPKLTFAGLPTCPPSFPPALLKTHPPSKDS